MRTGRNTLATLALLALVFSGPAAVAAYLFSTETNTAPLMLSAVDAGDGAATGAPVGTAAEPVLMGVLYTRGSALVDWNGVKIPVENGSYAYLGGEAITTAPDAMGILELDRGGSIYTCPGSRLSVSRSDSGAVNVRISRGTGRFALQPGTDFRIQAKRGVLTPSAEGGDPQGPTVGEVSVFEDHPGGVVCGFANSVDVAGYGASGTGAPMALGTASPGQIVDLARALDEEQGTSGSPVAMHPIAMPAGVQDWLQANAPYPAHPGPIGYLCRCLELKRYADADGIPDAAIVPRMLPPDTGTAALAPASDSPVAPPLAPSVMLAEPGAPDPADPGMPLSSPPPAPLTVPPPLIPAGGSGGGVTSTAS
jgi:hypothetical protein